MKRSIGAVSGAFLLALSLFPSAAFPVLYIDINAPGGKRMPIAVADVAVGSGDPSLSRGIPTILSDDLALTDLFDLIPPTAHLETVTAAHFSGKPLSFPGWKMIGAGDVPRNKPFPDMIHTALREMEIGRGLAFRMARRTESSK